MVYSRLLLIGLLATLTVACASLGKMREPPVVNLAGLQMGEMTLFEQRYQLQLRVQNPNDDELPISGLYCTLYINDREFAKGVSNANVTVPRFGEALLSVDVVSDLRRVLEQLRDAGGKPVNAVSYRLSGKLALQGSPIPVPFDYHGEFDMQAKP